MDSGRGGSYSRLADLGHALVRFTEDVNVRLPNDAEQRTLELEGTQPVFEIWHVAYTAEDRPVEVCIHVMTGHLSGPCAMAGTTSSQPPPRSPHDARPARHRAVPRPTGQ
ncbi:UTRA domain-containing protein [Krasilnikovia sp. M28-CT-15]|uniref:UTRA domain-containing protein n=1 Tax=Krasilnikovia sp. M28-CT-15 TaxID=3373540 RepID=UPI00399D49A0